MLRTSTCELNVYEPIFSIRALGIINFKKNVFSKFYRRPYELISKFNIGLKTLLRNGLSEPEFYGDLVYRFKTNNIDMSGWGILNIHLLFFFNLSIK